MNLSDTIEPMVSSNYKNRFIAEWMQLKIRYEKLKEFCNRIEAAEIVSDSLEVPEPEHDCPLQLLRHQQKIMGEYLHILELRAVIEHIELKGV